MRLATDARNAVGEEPPRLDALQPDLRAMDWTDDSATDDQLSSLTGLGYRPMRPLTKGRAAHLIRNFERNPQRALASAEIGVREITKRQAYLLQQAVEEAGRAVQEATEDEAESLQYILAVTTAKRLDFWTDTCREPPQMRECSAQVVDLFTRYGCRFVAPSGEQVQEILNALDLLMPSWDRHQPELFYQTMELNFPELDRLVL